MQQYQPGWVHPDFSYGPYMFANQLGNDRGTPSPTPSTTSSDSAESLQFTEGSSTPFIRRRKATGLTVG